MTTIRHFCWLATLVVFLLVMPAGLVAQASPDASSETSAQEAQPASSTGAALSHASREAAGEEKDEMAEFKESASVRMLAKLTGGDVKKAYWLSVILNFAVIAGIIIWFSRSKLPGMFRARTESIQKAMSEAQKASEEARARLAQVEARLAKLGDEIAGMRATAEQEAAAEEARIKAAAEEDARKIVASAEQEIAAAAKSARRELTAHAAELAVSLAAKQIKVDPATDQTLVRNFAQQLSSNGGKERS
jgi:F-type H+-transporting ATPase subunit b